MIAKQGGVAVGLWRSRRDVLGAQPRRTLCPPVPGVSGIGKRPVCSSDTSEKVLAGRSSRWFFHVSEQVARNSDRDPQARIVWTSSQAISPSRCKAAPLISHRTLQARLIVPNTCYGVLFPVEFFLSCL